MEFADLVERYRKPVFNLAFRVTFSMEDAEDITQETFLTVHRKISQYREESSPLTWIYKIALNLSLRHKSKVDRRFIENLDEELHAHKGIHNDELQAWENNPENHYLVTELMNEIRQECTYFLTFTLTPEQRITYILRTILGVSMTEIAEVLEVDESTVKSRLFRARQNLMKHFQTNCHWLNSGSTCNCRDRLGFAIHYVPQILERVKTTADPEGSELVARELKKIPDLYEKFEHLPLFNCAT